MTRPDIAKESRYPSWKEARYGLWRRRGRIEFLEIRAQDFATYHHKMVQQVRKYTGDPYIVHPAAVVEIVRGTHYTEDMVAAAWMHDTVEDTQATIAEITEAFWPRVASLVEMLTDVSRPEDGNRAARKAIDRTHLSHASPDAKTIKLADLIDNTRSIVAHDPAFACVYLAEKAALLEVLREGDPRLYRCAQNLLAQSRQALSAPGLSGPFAASITTEEP
jgi:hypothetical protein